MQDILQFYRIIKFLGTEGTITIHKKMFEHISVVSLLFQIF